MKSLVLLFILLSFSVGAHALVSVNAGANVHVRVGGNGDKAYGKKYRRPKRRAYKQSYSPKMRRKKSSNYGNYGGGGYSGGGYLSQCTTQEYFRNSAVKHTINDWVRAMAGPDARYISDQDVHIKNVRKGGILHPWTVVKVHVPKNKYHNARNGYNCTFYFDRRNYCRPVSKTYAKASAVSTRLYKRSKGPIRKVASPFIPRTRKHFYTNCKSSQRKRGGVVTYYPPQQAPQDYDRYPAEQIDTYAGDDNYSPIPSTPPPVYQPAPDEKGHVSGSVK